MPDFGANGKLGIQKLVLEKVFDTNKSLAWTIRLKIDRGHNGPCPTINVIPGPDRNRVKNDLTLGVLEPGPMALAHTSAGMAEAADFFFRSPTLTASNFAAL